VNAQKLVGADKIAKPTANWGENEWNEFFSQVGRPGTPQDYKPLGEQALGGVEIDEEAMKKAYASFHELGLTQKQVDGVLGLQIAHMKGSAEAQQLATEQGLAEAKQALQAEYGDNYDQKLELAKGVLGKYGDNDLIKMLDETGMGNDPRLIRLFSKIGEQLVEDDATGQGAGLFSTDAAASRQEIEGLKADVEFQKALNDRTNPGHKGAVERWTALHERAYSGTVKPS